MTFEDQIIALNLYPLEDHSANSYLVQVLKYDDLAKRQMAIGGCIEKSSFSRGLQRPGGGNYFNSTVATCARKPLWLSRRGIPP